MNILIDALPTAVMIGDQEVPINTDFRDCLRVILAFEDHDLTPTERTLILLNNLFPEPPPDGQIAVQQAIKFLNGGESTDGDAGDGLRLYGFGHDANLIFAAFRQTHGIDLEAVENLHWWKFVALFMDLGADTAFCQLVGLRKRVKTGKASEDERKTARSMGDTFDLPEPDTRTPEEKERSDKFLRTAREAEKKRRAEKEKEKATASE